MPTTLHHGGSVRPPGRQHAGWPVGGAVSARCQGLGYWYGATVGGVPTRHVVLGNLSIQVGRAACEAVVGYGLGPATLLRCVAGLLSPMRGSLLWLDRSGAPGPPLPVALLPVGWSAYSCLTVRDVVEQGVAAGTWQALADRIVVRALALCLLGPLAGRRVHELARPWQRVVAMAAMLAGGARWFLIEGAGVERAWNGRGCGGEGGRRLEAAVMRRLALTGHTLILAGAPGSELPIPPQRVLRLPPGRLEQHQPPDVVARVAEGCPVAPSSEAT